MKHESKYERVLIKNKTKSTGKHCQDRKSFITEKKTFLPKYRNLYNFRTINLHELYKFTAVHHNIPKNEENNEHKRCTDGKKKKKKNHKIQTALSWVAQNFFFFVLIKKKKEKREKNKQEESISTEHGN